LVEDAEAGDIPMPIGTVMNDEPLEPRPPDDPDHRRPGKNNFMALHSLYKITDTKNIIRINPHIFA
jgi:hypothetical protein